MTTDGLTPHHGALRVERGKRYVAQDVQSREDTARLLESGSQSDESDMEGYANEAATGPAVQAGSDEADTSDREVAPAADSYTVDEAVETLGFGWFQVRIIAIGGVLTAADAMEMLLLSVLGPALRCEWFLSSSQIALITTVVFIGMCIGAPIWGYLSDHSGRKSVFTLVMAMIAYFGLLTSLSPTFSWIIILRGLVGFSIAGGAASFTLMSEYLPRKYRAKILILTAISWAVGSTFEIILTYLVLPTLGWRMLVFLSSLPLFVFLIFTIWLPESARFLLAAGKTDKAAKVLNDMARLNKMPPLKGHPISHGTQETRGHIKYLFSKNYRWTYFSMLFLWFGIAFIYYGIILVSAEIFRFHHDCFAERKEVIVGHNITEVIADKSCCQRMTNDDYKAMLISSFGEFVIIPVNFVIIDALGRKPTLALGYLFAGVFFGLLQICTSKNVITFFLFMIRAFAAGIFNTVYVYTSEVFPTTVRSVGLGTCSAVARVGSMTTPYIAQVLMPDVSVSAGVWVYVGVCSLCAALSILLPIETKGREMPQSVQDPERQVPSSFVYRKSEPEHLEMH